METEIEEVPTKEFYASLDGKRGELQSHYDESGNRWLLFHNDGGGIDVLQFVPNALEKE